jgi:CBS domain containing-hemolysin-like protein
MMFEFIAAVAFVIIASALCSGTEAAIFSLPLAKARQLAEKNRNGKIVCNIRENSTRPIATIVILNNLFNIAGTFLVAKLAVTALSPAVQVWFPFALTAAVIVFSEIIPKTVGERFSKPIICFLARPLSWLTLAALPVIWLIEKLVRLIIGEQTRNITSEKEIRALAKIGHQEGVIDEDEKVMIGRVFELDDEMAVDIMTPRTELSWVHADSTLREIKQIVADSQHSRLLVVGDTIDDVRGILLKGRVLKEIVAGNESKLVSDVSTDVQLFREDTPADELLEFFRDAKVHLAAVVDEYGGVSGIVTIEDVIEVLTGEIMDETDQCEDLQAHARQKAKEKLSPPPPPTSPQS